MAHVLIVFADPSQTEVPALVCDGVGHTCSFAREAEAGEALSAVKFDLVLLIVERPARLARAVRLIHRHIPIVAVVNELSPHEASAARREGVSALIYRPYSMQTLRKAIADELGGDLVAFERREAEAELGREA